MKATVKCPACSRDAPGGSRFCPACSVPLGPISQASTWASRFDSPRRTPGGGGTGGAGWLSSSDTFGQSRFLPGTVLGGRYRIVGPVGRGGMGEVYRADDLKLGQSVALKFLPEELEHDEGRLERFFNEVRTARQVTHPNVCRVYDVGDIEGKHFLSMEFVDGEDLASLLRRIGRLPEDRAVQVARQMCAGLAAAHAQGILHRDLKPGNVMIDGRGNVRITDFGLAGLAEEIGEGERRAGTPAYQAPEQLTGKDVSTRSDIYSLGLVLYELFTGKQAFEATSRAELEKLHLTSSLATPSSLVGSLDPTVERAILRCLETDPHGRPDSALKVSAALPGGDPLAAALAAGETPSPEMVAAAGEEGGLHAVPALLALSAILLGMVGMVFLSDEAHFVRRVPLRKPPQALAVDAQEIIRDLGYDAVPVDSFQGFTYDIDYIRHVEMNDPSPNRWQVLGSIRPAPVWFWYRESPRSLVPYNFNGWVGLEDPPPLVSGMINVKLDSEGRLIELLAVPPERDDAVSDEPADLSALLSMAGLEQDRLTPETPTWNPPINCQNRAAWSGSFEGQESVPIRVESCSYDGKPAYFEVIMPWTRPTRMEASPVSAGLKAAATVVWVFFVIILGTAIAMAWRNMRLGRGDPRGAFRVALYGFCLWTLADIVGIHHVSEMSEIPLLLHAVQSSLFGSAMVWLLYVALEPTVRRLWPDTLISWNRLLAGRLKDPLVGRDILVGALVAVVASIASMVYVLSFSWLGFPGQVGSPTPVYILNGIRGVAWLGISCFIESVFLPMILLFLVFLFRIAFRREWVAVVMVISLLAGIGTLAALSTKASVMGLGAYIFLGSALLWAPFLYIIVRYGIVASIVYGLFWTLHSLFPLTFDGSVWYSGPTLVMVFVCAAIAVYGFAVARAGRPLLKEQYLFR